MKKVETIYRSGQTVTVVQAKISENSKIGIGYIVQTYHFSIDQIVNLSLSGDSKNCFDCPLSFNQNNGKSGGCYTHKGMQLMGLKSMLKRLNKLYLNGEILEEQTSQVQNFADKVRKIYPVDLVRFGAYGEPILLGEENTNILASLGKKFTGYTHQFTDLNYNWSKDYFMSSAHNEEDLKKAKIFGFRSFIAKDKNTIVDGVNCPASKESDKNLSCIVCGLCNGQNKGIKKDIYINIH